jgi:hypothetical protein
MSPAEVEALVGRPLEVVPWNLGTAHPKQELWCFSDRPEKTANFHRRWVLFEYGKVVEVINDFWID